MKFALLALLMLAIFGALIGAGVYFLQPTLADIRDVIVIIYGIMGILLFVVLIAVSAAVFVGVRALSGKAGALLDEPIRPVLNEVLETARNARAASEFYADHAVNPVIKTVAAARGVRRGFSSVARMVRRGKK